MQTPDQTGNTAAITDLRDRWDQLEDVGRAVAVHKIHRDGTSLRSLAKVLNCSESLLRHLDLAAQAPALDLILARNGKITTREMARRGRAAIAKREIQAGDEAKCKRMQAAQQASKTICDWLDEEKLWPAHGEGIIDEARMILFGAERQGTLPQGQPPPDGTPVEEIIRRCRPKSETDDSSDVARYAHWLAVWAFYAFPDSVVRDRALNLALDKQIRG